MAYIPNNADISERGGSVSREWLKFFTLLNAEAGGGGGGGITQLTGDVLAGPGSGSVAAVLSNTGVVAGTYGTATAIPQLTVTARGRLTSVVNVPITGGSIAVDVDAAGALDGDGTTADPLAVRVDGSTIIINGSNNLEVVGGGGGSQWSVLTNGDVAAPELIFAGGDVIMLEY
jgi:hypothetical protein